MTAANGTLAFMSGGGEAGAVMRDVDWSKTPLGPVPTWSHALRTTVSTLLHSRHPMFLWWGPQLVQLYNDAYRPSFGAGKHPAAMGQPGADCWQEIWPIIWPQIRGVMEEGTATYHEDQLVPIWRNGRLEEVFWTYGYSPVRDDGGEIGGCLVVCTETTGRALAERRLTFLHSLTQRTAPKTDMSSVIAATAQTLEEQATHDVMFALFHLGEQRLVPCRSVGVDETVARAINDFLRPKWKQLAGTRKPVPLPPELQRSSRTWPEPVDQVVVERFGESESYLVFGLSPRLSYDKAYGEFLAQIAGHLTASGARVNAFHARLLVESERNNLLMQAPVATALLTGPDLVFQLANPKCIELVGGRQLVGKGFLEAFPESENTQLASVLFEAYHTGQRYSADELCVTLRRDGKQGSNALEDYYFTFALEPLRSPSGEAYGLMAVAGDITAQVRARKELETTQSELLKASQAKDEFLAMLGHELRNPLSPIMTALELMRLRNIKEGAEERAVIERQLKHVVALVDDLLDVARITRGELTLQRSRLLLGDVIRRAIEQASPLLEHGEHRLEVHVDDTLFIDADPNRLAQVVSNLLTNAAKYTDPGGSITVHAGRADQAPPTPEQGDNGAPQHVAGNAALVRVVDTGIGLAQDDPARMFDTFQRGGRSPRHGGLGLGLAIVKSLVVAHGGKVSLHSRGLGHGTEARVWLPLATAPASSSSKATVTSPLVRPVPHRRVLIVDDNEDAATLLSMALTQLGHEVRTVYDGAAALRLAETYVPEIALLDLGMPVMSGFELARQLQRRPDWKHVRFVAVTGYGQPSDRQRTRAAGFAAHVVKPIEVREVDEQIRALAPADGPATQEA